MSSLPYAAVCSGAIPSSAVVQPHCSFDRLGGRREGKTDLAVLRSCCPVGMLFVLFSYKSGDGVTRHDVTSHPHDETVKRLRSDGMSLDYEKD